MLNQLSLFGVLNVNKPAGMTSRDVVNVVQRMVRPAKCGHAGTLDPMATGVLLICVGPATRLISLLQNGQKQYVAEFTLGQRSDTDDNTGKIELTPEPVPRPDRSMVQACIDSMIGTISQRPPDYSAVHVDGQRAYKLAREGQQLTLAEKSVRVDRIAVDAYDFPRLVLTIECGSGTYVRSIARDLGDQLGCGGLMSGLVRTRVGRFRLGNAVSPDELTAESLFDHIVPARSIVAEFPFVKCSPAIRKSIVNGNAIAIAAVDIVDPGDGASGQIALVDAQTDELLGLAEPDESGTRLRPRIVFVRG